MRHSGQSKYLWGAATSISAVRGSSAASTGQTPSPRSWPLLARARGTCESRLWQLLFRKLRPRSVTQVCYTSSPMPYQLHLVRGATRRRGTGGTAPLRG